ncbi:MAG: hypothetical protein M1823_001923 [Watsoniomyces obsoletus]|nr:MAG: hypothetical protein M1823_001923 [Watsoniomyces obsoletus]
MNPNEDDEYLIPLKDQRVFGAGLKRKRVHFVPPAPELEGVTAQQPTRGESVASFYESLVLPNSTNSPASVDPESPAPTTSTGETQICEICKLPIQPSITADTVPRPHESSLAHQVCLTHSHPPSHLDQRNKGLQYLSSYGWDPNDRRGLGPEGEGRLFPIKPKVKGDKLGIGAKLPKAVREAKVEKKPEKLDAKKIRKREAEAKRKAEKMHQLFYQADDVNRYLGMDV